MLKYFARLLLILMPSMCTISVPHSSLITCHKFLKPWCLEHQTLKALLAFNKKKIH